LIKSEQIVLDITYLNMLPF